MPHLRCALALQPVFMNTSGNPKMWFSSPGRGPTRTKPTAGQSWRSHERPRSQQHHAALAGWPTALRPAPPYASSMRSRHANTGSPASSRAVALTLLAIMKKLNTMMSAYSGLSPPRNGCLPSVARSGSSAARNAASLPARSPSGQICADEGRRRVSQQQAQPCQAPALPLLKCWPST